MKPEWRSVLEARRVKDKIGVAIDCDVAPVGQLETISELVREGLMVWIDRSVLRHLGVMDGDGNLVRRGINTDIYQLTLKGIKLCNENGIKGQ